MSGYGFRDSSVIVQAIGDYAKYNENKRRYDDETKYNRGRQQVADMQNLRIFDNQMADYERTKRIEKNYDQSLEAYTADEEARAEQRKVGLLDTPGGKALAAGHSGKGVGFAAIDNGDDTVDLGNVDKDGNETPFNLQPDNPNSPTMRVPKERLPEFQQRAEYLASTEGVAPKDIPMFVRAGFKDRGDGILDFTTPEEFEARLADNMSLANPSQKQAEAPAPAIDERPYWNYNRKTEEMGKLAADTVDHVKGRLDAYTNPKGGGYEYGKDLAAAGTMIPRAGAKVGTAVASTVGPALSNYFSDPTQAKAIAKNVEVDKEGKFQPKADASPKDVAKTHQALVDQGIDPMTVMPEDVSASISTYLSLPAGPEQMQYVAQEYGSTAAGRRFAKAKLQYDGDLAAYRNFVDTGDPSTSLRMIAQDRNEAIKIAQTSREYNRKVTEMKWRYRKEAAEDQAKASKDYAEAQKELLGDWKKEMMGAFDSAFARDYNPANNFKIPFGQASTGAAGIADQAIDNFFVMYPESKQLIGSPAFNASMKQAYSEFGIDFARGNTDGGSAYPYFARSLVPHDAYDPKRINQISVNHKIPVDKVTNEVVSAYRWMIQTKIKQGLDPNLSEEEVKGIMAKAEVDAKAAKENKQ